MGNQFEEWLQAELTKRGWTQSELARRADTTSTTVSRILNRERMPGVDFCKGVARAFGMRDAEVFRIAGLIGDAVTDEVIRLAEEPASIADWFRLGRELTEEERYQALQYARFLREQRATYDAQAGAKPASSKPKKATGNAT